MNELTVTEYKDIRVLTTQQIAEAYKTDGKTVSYNFNHNRERYEDGKHFICLVGDELKAFREIHELPSNISKLYLWTEKGAFLHAKSLNTDEAWEVYGKLVDSYFVKKQPQLPTTYKEALQQLLSQVEENEKLIEQKSELEESVKKMDKVICDMTPKVDYVDRILSSTDCMTVTQIAQDYGMSAKRFNQILANACIQRHVCGQWILYADHQGKGYVRNKTCEYQKSNGTGTNLLTVWTQKGRMFLYDRLKTIGIEPVVA